MSRKMEFPGDLDVFSNEDFNTAVPHNMDGTVMGPGRVLDD
jgi:hypothetical protein